MVDTRDTTSGRKWVVGVDGSEHSSRALRWAAHNAPGRTSTLRVLRAWSAPVSGGLAMVPSMIDELQPETADDSLDSLAAELEPRGVAVDGLVEYGASATVLLGACDDADLLVVGARGLGGFSRLLLGSTSFQCATHARVPVVVVSEPTDADSDIDRIVVGMDGSFGARAALAWALDFAPNDAVISVVGALAHGVTTGLAPAPLDVDEALVEFHSAVGEVEVASAMKGRCERHLIHDHAATALLSASSGADLLVVGERGRRGLKLALLGSVTTEVLHRADRPVVVVPIGE